MANPTINAPSSGGSSLSVSAPKGGLPLGTPKLPSAKAVAKAPATYAPGSAEALVHQYFDNAIAQVNANHTAEMARLGGLQTSAAQGVTNVGNQAMGQLNALGADAKANDAQSRGLINNDYSTAQSQTDGQFQQLLKDLQTQGANTQALGAEAGARQSALQSQAALQGSTSDRLSQLLNQSVNDRQATSRQVTQGSLNDLQRALEGAQFNAGQIQQQSLNQLDQQQAAQMLQVKMQELAQAAAARAAAASGRGKGGMTLGEAMGLYGKLQGMKGSNPQLKASELQKLADTFHLMRGGLMPGTGGNSGVTAAYGQPSGYQGDLVNNFLNALAQGQSAAGLSQQFGNQNPHNGAVLWGPNANAETGNYALDTSHGGQAPANMNSAYGFDTLGMQNFLEQVAREQSQLGPSVSSASQQGNYLNGLSQFLAMMGLGG